MRYSDEDGDEESDGGSDEESDEESNEESECWGEYEESMMRVTRRVMG
jgi:hypothetical protein